MSYCGWDEASDEMRFYHDTEWGVPLKDDRLQFEFLSMEVMQCGLSFGLIMNRRQVLRDCFDDFDYEKVARYTEADVERIMQTPGMIRAVRKIRAIIGNAQAFLQVREEFGTFSDYLWGFTEGRTVLYDGHASGYIPASNGLSERISRDLKQRGFRFVGGITIYSHLQACGIICDHDSDCPCYQRIITMYPTVRMKPDAEKQVRFYGKGETS